MSAKHLFIIGFAYTFGYLIPTIRLIQMLDTVQLYMFMASYAIRCQSCDLVFTVILSKRMLQRQLFQRTPVLYEVVVLLLAILAFYFNDHLLMVQSDAMPVPANNPNGAILYKTFSQYQFLMARFCYCFVIVGQKIFVLKELAFQKAWS